MWKFYLLFFLFAPFPLLLLDSLTGGIIIYLYIYWDGLLELHGWRCCTIYKSWHSGQGHFSAPVVSSRPCTVIAVQTLHSSSQPPHIPGDLHPCPGYIGLWQSLSAWFSFHSDCHRSAAALSNSLKSFSTVPNNCLNVGIWLVPQFPKLPCAGPVLLTVLFFLSFLHPTGFSMD